MRWFGRHQEPGSSSTADKYILKGDCAECIESQQNCDVVIIHRYLCHAGATLVDKVKGTMMQLQYTDFTQKTEEWKTWKQLLYAAACASPAPAPAAAPAPGSKRPRKCKGEVDEPPAIAPPDSGLAQQVVAISIGNLPGRRASSQTRVNSGKVVHSRVMTAKRSVRPGKEQNQNGYVAATTTGAEAAACALHEAEEGCAGREPQSDEPLGPASSPGSTEHLAEAVG